MKRSHYIIGGLALAISMPSCLQAQTTHYGCFESERPA